MRKLTFDVEINSKNGVLYRKSGFKTLAEAKACKELAEKEFDRTGTIISVLNNLNTDDFDEYRYNKEIN